MKCDGAHKQIHLFGELTEPERSQVIQHLDTCASCQELFTAVESMHKTVKRAAGVWIEPLDSGRLTNSIMTRIDKPEPKHFYLFGSTSGYLEYMPVKWALAAASLVLACTLAIEQMSPRFSETTSSTVVIPTGNQMTVLDMRIFQEELTKRKKTEILRRLDNCWDPFKATQYSIDCLKEAYRLPKVAKRRS